MANPNKLAVIKLDAIGDYILFRNYLSQIKSSRKYRSCHLTLIGNVIWRDLAENFDSDYVDHFIWLDLNKFSKSRLYRNLFFTKLKLLRFDVVLCAVYSRRFYVEDDIVKNIRGKVKIGSVGDTSNSTLQRQKISNSYYSKLFSIDFNETFEFFRNKQFIEKFLEEEINPTLRIQTSSSSIFKGDFIIICPGAGAKFRMWSLDNFARLCSKIISYFNSDIIICGSSNDKELAKIILRMIGSKKVIDKCGHTSLTEMLDLIKESKLIIANESSSIHMAAALDINAICLSNGNHFGRFNPYPKEITNKVNTIYPQIIKNKLEVEYDELIEHYFWGSDEDINGITVDEVFDMVQKILKH